MEVSGSPPLYTQPPEAGEGPIRPLNTLAQGLQMPLTLLWVFRILTRIGQVYGDEASVVSPENRAVYIRELPQEGRAACSGKSPNLPSDAHTVSSNYSTCRVTSQKDLR